MHSLAEIDPNPNQSTTDVFSKFSVTTLILSEALIHHLHFICNSHRMWIECKYTMLGIAMR